jgi:hypothetical protein
MLLPLFPNMQIRMVEERVYLPDPRLFQMVKALGEDKGPLQLTLHFY